MHKRLRVVTLCCAASCVPKFGDPSRLEKHSRKHRSHCAEGLRPLKQRVGVKGDLRSCKVQLVSLKRSPFASHGADG